MIRRDKVRSKLKDLREALALLDRYRWATSWVDFDRDDGVRHLIEYALLRALTLTLDIVKEWAPPRTPQNGPPKYEDGLWPMQRDNVLDESLVARLGESIQLRNDLAHFCPTISRERVFTACQDSDWLVKFVGQIDGYLSALLVNIQAGQILAGVVTGIVQYGAFVDVGGVQGLVHISQMSLGRVRDPGDLVTVGEDVLVLVREIDPDTERISLALEPLRESA